MLVLVFQIFILYFCLLVDSSLVKDDHNSFLSFTVVHSKREEIEHNHVFSNTSRSLLLSGEKFPLFQGMGVHYSYIWVGSPPQRVSVILDTGSHHTAFPCVGCSCGKHMDPHFDPSKSSTSLIKTCGIANRKCFFSQSYSEGSSWQAYRLSDKVFLGSESLDPSVYTPEYQKENSVDFDFGCQTLETGLFRTQNIDGIMGLSASPETFPYYLFNKSVTKNRLFSLCFTNNGGTFTVGGVDRRLHMTKKNNQLVQSEISYAKLVKSSGWYTVHLLDIKLLTPDEHLEYSEDTDKNLRKNIGQSIGGNINRCNEGKGTIVDSGTTDTYLPYQLQKSFSQLFNKITGLVYRNEAIILSPEQYKSLPIIMYEFEGTSGGKVQVSVTPDTYVQKLKNGRYIFRIYLTESIGAVLGSNFIFNHDVIFDIDNMRVGFAKSTCKFQSNEPLNNPTRIQHTNTLSNNTESSWLNALFNKGKNHNLLPITLDSTPMDKLAERKINETINHSFTKFLLTPCSAHCPVNTKPFINTSKNFSSSFIKYSDKDKNVRSSNLIQVQGQSTWKNIENNNILVENCEISCGISNSDSDSLSNISSDWSACNTDTCNRFRLIDGDETNIQSEICFSSLKDCSLPKIVSASTKDYLLLSFNVYQVPIYHKEAFLSSLSDLLQVPRSFIWIQESHIDSTGSLHDLHFLHVYLLIDSDNYWKQVIQPGFQKISGSSENNFSANKLAISKYVKELLSSPDLHFILNSLILSSGQFMPYSLNIKDFSLVNPKSNKVVSFNDLDVEQYQVSDAFSISELQKFIKYHHSTETSWTIYFAIFVLLFVVLLFLYSFRRKATRAKN